MARPTYLYAVYRGDALEAFGTAAQCAEALGVKESFVRFLATPTAHKKADMAKRENSMVAERVEMEEECE